MGLISCSANKISGNEYLLQFVLLIFIVVAFAFAESGLLLPFTVLLVAVLFICKYMDQTLLIFKDFPIELKLLNLWMLFAFFTGYFVAIDHINFFDGMSKLFFYIMIANVVAIILLYKFRLFNTIIYGIILAGIINLVSVYLGIGADYAEATGRAVGLNSNPNTLGLKVVYASAALIFFIVVKRLNLKYIIISLILLSAFFQTILMSGSRKSLLTFLVFFLVSVVLYYTRDHKKIKLSTIAYSLILLITLGAIANIGLPVLLEGSSVGDRIEMGSERGGVEGDIRYEMYLYALELFSDHPLLGIGINNFKNYFWSGQYSHSDYAESISSTGLLGFLIYQSVYLIVLFRSMKIFFNVKDKLLRTYAGMAALFIIMLKVVGTGVILFYSPAPLIILVVFSILTIQIKRNNLSIA